MRTAWLSLRDRMDRVGITLSGLCLLHCVAGLLLVTGLGIGGQWLLAPVIHRIGLALAIAVGLLTIGVGVLRHGQLPPLIVGTIGLLLMGGGLFVEHGMEEAVLTISGVVLLAVAHILNLRHAH